MSNHIKSLLLGFAAFIGLLVCVLGISSYAMIHAANSTLDEQVDAATHMRDLMGDVKYQITEIQQFLTDASATGESDPVQEARNTYADLKSTLDEIGKFDKQYLDEVEALRQAAETQFNTGLKMVAAYKESQAAGNAIMKANDGFDVQSANAKATMDKLFSGVQNDRDKAFKQVDDQLEHALTITLILGSVILAASIGGAWFLYRKVYAILGGEPAVATKLSASLADGDLSRTIRVESQLQSSLLGQLDRMNQRWRSIATELRQEVDTVSGVSEHLSQSAHALSHGSAAQSDAIAAVAGNIEQLTNSINVIADHASDACKNVEQANASAAEGVHLLDDVSTTIRKLSSLVTVSAGQVNALDEKTKQIESIVTVIREIADQTNLLALNAAIEAARAGESGRGFAVVADEVRKLAERTSNSTSSIAAMIDEVHDATKQIVETIDNGVSSAEESLAKTERIVSTMGHIQTQNQDTVQRVNNISSELAEQRANAQDIARQVERVNQTIESNAQAADAVARSSDEVASAAATVKQSVSFFRF